MSKVRKSKDSLHLVTANLDVFLCSRLFTICDVLNGNLARLVCEPRCKSEIKLKAYEVSFGFALRFFRISPPPSVAFIKCSISCDSFLCTGCCVNFSRLLLPSSFSFSWLCFFLVLKYFDNSDKFHLYRLLALFSLFLLFCEPALARPTLYGG